MTDEQIISALGFDEADDEMKARVVENARTIVELRVINVVSNLITGEQEPRFQELIAAGDNAAVWAWLREEVAGVDVSEIYAATLGDYIEEYLQRQAAL
jgi:hypothetical protein